MSATLTAASLPTLFDDTGRRLLLNARPITTDELNTLRTVSEHLDENLALHRRRVGRSLTKTEIADSVAQSLAAQHFPVETLSEEQRQLLNEGLMMVELQEGATETKVNRASRSAVGCFFCKAGLWLAFVAAGIGVALLLAIATVAVIKVFAVGRFLVRAVLEVLKAWFKVQVRPKTVAQILGRVIGLGVGASASGGALGGAGAMLDELITSSCKEWGAC